MSRMCVGFLAKTQDAQKKHSIPNKLKFEPVREKKMYIFSLFKTYFTGMLELQQESVTRDEKGLSDLVPLVSFAIPCSPQTLGEYQWRASSKMLQSHCVWSPASIPLGKIGLPCWQHAPKAFG